MTLNCINLISDFYDFCIYYSIIIANWFEPCSVFVNWLWCNRFLITSIFLFLSWAKTLKDAVLVRQNHAGEMVYWFSEIDICFCYHCIRIATSYNVGRNFKMFNPFMCFWFWDIDGAVSCFMQSFLNMVTNCRQYLNCLYDLIRKGCVYNHIYDFTVKVFGTQHR